MAWTAPRTWVTSEVVTASVMNTHVRDNLSETVPAKAVSGTARYFVSTGLNAVAERLAVSAAVDTTQTTTSTSFTDLATVGPAVTTTSGTFALIVISSGGFNNTGGEQGYAGVAVSGATTLSATDSKSIAFESSAANDVWQASYAYVETGLTAGSNTFTMEYHVTGGTGSFRRRRLSVLPF